MLIKFPKEILWSILDYTDTLSMYRVLLTCKKIACLFNCKKSIIKIHLQKHFTPLEISGILYQCEKNNLVQDLYFKIKDPMLAMYHVFANSHPSLFISQLNNALENDEIYFMSLVETLNLKKHLVKNLCIPKKILDPMITFGINAIDTCIFEKLVQMYVTNFYSEYDWDFFTRTCIEYNNVNCFCILLKFLPDTNVNWSNIFSLCCVSKNMLFLKNLSDFFVSSNIRIFISKLLIGNLMKSRLFINVLHIIRLFLKETVNYKQYVIEIAKYSDTYDRYCNIIYQILTPESQKLFQRIKMNTKLKQRLAKSHAKLGGVRS